MAADTLIGFDAREMGRDTNAIYILGNQDSYLLREDIGKPLSTDTMIWASVVDHADEGGKPLWTGTFTDLWDSLARLEGHLTRHQPAAAASYWIIGVTILTSMAADFWSSRGSDQAIWPAVTPPQRDKTLTFLGYDVSDRYLLSGLSNCGKDADEIPAMRRQFGPHLNDHHLFTAPEPALAYKKWADQDPGHAPFFVFGLYRIRDTGQAAADEAPVSGSASSHKRDTAIPRPSTIQNMVTEG